jgi:hypothetical protein
MGKKNEVVCHVVKKVAILKFVEFSTIVALDEPNGTKEEGSYISLEINKDGVDIRFVA